MLQDFAKSAARHKQRQASSKPPARISRVRIAVTLLLTVGLGFGLYHLTEIRPELSPAEAVPQTAARAEQPAGDQAVATTTPATRAKPAKEAPFYDFYTLLPESEVIAPKVEEYSYRPKNPATRDRAYLLQAGSFRSKRDADRLRAKLILQGLDVKLSAVTGRNGRTWHRVVVGPFLSRSSLNRAQDILADANTESMLILAK